MRGIAASIRSLHVSANDAAFESAGKALDAMIDWLRGNVAAADYACHSAPGLACSTAAFYFRNIETAHAFVSAFPAAGLADGIASPAYSTARLRGGERGVSVC